MSQENVERLRQALDAFDRQDRPAWLALSDQDREVVPSSAWPEAEVIRGGEAVWDFYVGVVATFEDFASGDAELVDAGADKVLVHRRTQVRGRTSGVDVGLDFWVVVTFRDGKILRDHWFADQAEALEAVGLSE
jgi:ketosteroid isomerase-like protein